MEQATIFDFLQIVGVLLKVFAFVILCVTVAITGGVVVYLSVRASWRKRPVIAKRRYNLVVEVRH